MKTIKLISGILLGVVISATAIATYLHIALPKNIPAPELNIQLTETRLKRGKYLALHVAVCMDCHSTRDWSVFSAPIVPGTLGKGGEIMDRSKGLPGEIHTPNITPFALHDWTDGEIARAITTGISRNGNALFPLMSYARFGAMDEEDIYSIIAYIRSLDPIENTVPQTKLDFPVNLLNKTLPKEAVFSKLPDEKNTIDYGKYLVNASGCVDCHSKREMGKIIAGSEFGGGMEFSQPAGVITAPNITMHKENGIGNYSREAFVQRFKMYSDSAYMNKKLEPGELNSPMPWTMYAGMKSGDLEAIYDYLSNLKPIEHYVKVRNFKKKLQ